MRTVANLLTASLLMAVAAPFAGSAFAQDAVKSPSAISTNAKAPVPGKTSFTQGEAKSRMEKRGYTAVTDPVKTDAGIWHAEGKKPDGKLARIMVDYQGNVFEARMADQPVAGKTNLTSDQALAQMEKRGYDVTSIPIKDDQGIWYAEGILGQNQPVQVMVDYQGNVFESGEYSGHPSSTPGVPHPPLENPIKKSPLAGSQETAK